MFARPGGKLVFLRTAEMLKYYRLLQFSLLPCKSRSRYVIFCEAFNIFLFVFTFYSELEFHVPPFWVKLRNNKSVLANCQTGRPQYDRFLMEHNAKKRDESKCSQWKLLVNLEQNDYPMNLQPSSRVVTTSSIVKPRAESRANRRCRANVQFTKWDNYSTCPSFIQCMIEALKTARKSQLIIFPVSSHGSKWLADQKAYKPTHFLS